MEHTLSKYLLKFIYYGIYIVSGYLLATKFLYEFWEGDHLFMKIINPLLIWIAVIFPHFLKIANEDKLLEDWEGIKEAAKYFGTLVFFGTFGIFCLYVFWVCLYLSFDKFPEAFFASMFFIIMILAFGIVVIRKLKEEIRKEEEEYIQSVLTIDIGSLKNNSTAQRNQLLEKADQIYSEKYLMAIRQILRQSKMRPELKTKLYLITESALKMRYKKK